MKVLSKGPRLVAKFRPQLPVKPVQVIIETKSMDVLPHRAGTDLGISLPKAEQEKTA
jgi:hypothetical protein